MHLLTFDLAFVHRVNSARPSSAPLASTAGLSCFGDGHTHRKSTHRCIGWPGSRAANGPLARVWRSQCVCRSSSPDPGESDAGEPSESASALNLATDPSGTKVALTGFILLASVFILPRLALLSVVGVERVLVGTLLSFEQVAAAAIWTLLRWAGYLLAALLALSVLALAVLGTNDNWLDDMFAWSRSLTNLVTDEEEKASLQSFFSEKERAIREQKEELDRLSGKNAEDGKQ